MILEWCAMGCSRTSSGPLWSRYCRPPRVVRDARGQIIDRRWRASRGGIARVHRGGTYQSSLARGRPRGNAISAGHRTAPTNESSTRYVSRACSDRALIPISSSCCRWTRPWSEPTNTPRAPADHRSAPRAWRPPGRRGHHRVTRVCRSSQLTMPSVVPGVDGARLAQNTLPPQRTWPAHSLQPPHQQFRGPPVEFVGSSFDVGEHVDDAGQVLQIVAAAVPGRGRIRWSIAVCRFAEVDGSTLRGWPDPLPGRGDRLTRSRRAVGYLVTSQAAEPAATARDSSPG